VGSHRLESPTLLLFFRLNPEHPWTARKALLYTTHERFTAP
jgi:hypothetical protein